jgi:hypothetical protein
MKSLDLKEIINGLITVIIIALAVGQYGKLRDFAKREFVNSMKSTPSVLKKEYAR